MKSCVIVGNAQSILDYDYGNVIDGHEIVVRINVPRPKYRKNQGQKTNIIFANSKRYRYIERYRRRYNYEVIQILNGPGTLFEHFSIKMKEELNVEKARPTTGFIAIHHMYNLGYRPNLIGFDWFQTPSLSHVIRQRPKPDEKENGVWIHHYPEWEKNEVQKLLGVEL